MPFNIGYGRKRKYSRFRSRSYGGKYRRRLGYRRRKRRVKGSAMRFARHVARTRPIPENKFSSVLKFNDVVGTSVLIIKNSHEVYRVHQEIIDKGPGPGQEQYSGMRIKDVRLDLGFHVETEGVENETDDISFSIHKDSWLTVMLVRVHYDLVGVLPPPDDYLEWDGSHAEYTGLNVRTDPSWFGPYKVIWKKTFVLGANLRTETQQPLGAVNGVVIIPASQFGVRSAYRYYSRHFPLKGNVLFTNAASPDNKIKKGELLLFFMNGSASRHEVRITDLRWRLWYKDN